MMEIVLFDMLAYKKCWTDATAMIEIEIEE